MLRAPVVLSLGLGPLACGDGGDSGDSGAGGDGEAPDAGSLYYALLDGWVRLFGVSELALRVPSCLLFVAGVPLMARLARALFGQSERAAACAMVLYATSPPLIQFAQEARGYMLEVVLLMLSALALLRTLARPSFGWAMLAGATLGLALYAHMFAAWLGLVHGVWVLWCWRARHPTRWQLSAALAVSGLCALPLLISTADIRGDARTDVRTRVHAARRRRPLAVRRFARAPDPIAVVYAPGRLTRRAGLRSMVGTMLANKLAESAGLAAGVAVTIALRLSRKWNEPIIEQESPRDTFPARIASAITRCAHAISRWSAR